MKTCEKCRFSHIFSWYKKGEIIALKWIKMGIFSCNNWRWSYLAILVKYFVKQYTGSFSLRKKTDTKTFNNFIRIPRNMATIKEIILWTTKVFWYRLDSPQVNWHLISSATDFVYKLPHKWWNDLNDFTLLHGMFAAGRALVLTQEKKKRLYSCPLVFSGMVGVNKLFSQLVPVFFKNQYFAF